MTNEQLLKQIKGDKVKFILLQFSDIYGSVKSVTIPVEHLPDALEQGNWFDGSSIEGFSRIAESDMYLMPDPETYAVIPWLNSDDGHTARLICDIHNPDGTPFEGDPRYILKRAIKAAEEAGFEYMTGPELEFFLLERDHDLRHTPHDRANYFDMITDQAYEIRRDMIVALRKMGIDVEASHHEVAIGQHEIDFKYGPALATADNVNTIKVAAKAIAEIHGLKATFMPKPFAGINGSGMHVHQSLFDKKTGENAIYDANDKYGLSKTAYGFIAGQLRHVQAMSSVLSPTVNSYKRLVPGYEAPVYLSWARTNRSSLIRIPRFSAEKTSSARVELRNPDPSCNIYLALAVMLQAGLDGVKSNLTPPDPVEEDVYHLSEKERRDRNIDTLPGSLIEAINETKKNGLVKTALGGHTFDRYLEAKNKEWDEFRLQVTPWEFGRYVEMY